jgi:hypothetical protein
VRFKLSEIALGAAVLVLLFIAANERYKFTVIRGAYLSQLEINASLEAQIVEWRDAVEKQ